MNNKNQKIDWIIHFVVNGAECDCCGKTENSFPEFLCNTHTHGLEKYGHLDFQVVLAMPPELIGHLLNDLGLRVQAGEKFKDGDVIDDLLANGYLVRLIEVEETGRKVLRLLLPDGNNRFPGDKECRYPYNRQKNFKTN